MRFGFLFQVNTFGARNGAKGPKIERLEQGFACPINRSQTPQNYKK